ncbi:hypothetical protein G3I63_34030, partial [Streptomyces sp. SID8016]|nr:hypothetical protein [Streptomyces sp. SID8016]
TRAENEAAAASSAAALAEREAATAQGAATRAEQDAADAGKLAESAEKHAKSAEEAAKNAGAYAEEAKKAAERAEEAEREAQRQALAEAAKKNPKYTDPQPGGEGGGDPGSGTDALLQLILQFATAYALEQAGLSEEELAAARNLSGQDLLDYLKDNGAEILVELFAEDIMECIDDPDIGICIWAIVQNAGPVKLVKIGSKLPRIGKAIWGIKEFLEKVDKARKKVDTFTDKLDGAKEKLERLKATCDRGSGGGKSGASKASTVQRSAARADDKPKSDTGCVFPIFRTPKTVDVAYEKLHGPNPASRVEGGNDLIYFGEQSVAAEYWGRGTYASGMYRYDMDMQFLVKFADDAKRYDWGGPNGTPRIEWEIPYSRLTEFNRLTVDRTWIPKP